MENCKDTPQVYKVSLVEGKERERGGGSFGTERLKVEENISSSHRVRYVNQGGRQFVGF